MATANRPPVPVPPNLAKIKDPDTRMALQAIMDGWSVRNGWVGSGDNKFLTKADLEGYLSDPANAAFLSQVTGASGGSGGSGSGNGGLAYDQIKELSDWIKTTWLWKTLHELIPDIYSNTGLKKAVETLSSTVGAVQQKVLTLTDDAVKLFTLLGVSKSDKGVLAISGKYTSFESYIDSELTAFARDENGIISKSGGALAASLNVTTALAGKTAEDLATQYGWPLAGAVTSAATNITTLAAQNQNTINTLESALMVSDNSGSGAVMAYTLRANVIDKANPAGYKAGFGFSVERINGELRSIFLVGADTFAVYDPRITDTTNYILPFIVSNGKVYINDAVVVNLLADNIKGDVNKISPISASSGATFGSGGYSLIHSQTLPANPTHGHQHFAMLTITAQIGGTNGSLDGLFIDAHILSDGTDTLVQGFSNTNTMGGVTVTVAAPSRSTSEGTLLVYAKSFRQSGVITSLGGICGGLR